MIRREVESIVHSATRSQRDRFRNGNRLLFHAALDIISDLNRDSMAYTNSCVRPS